MALPEDEDCGHLHGFGDPDAKATKLQNIVSQRERDVADAKAKLPIEALEREAAAFTAQHGQPQSLVECLEAAEATGWKLALAAEFKRASPSKGDINAGLDAAAQALEYSQAGASVLSVLTEPKWFKGSLGDLRDVRLATQRWAAAAGGRRPACLRKDFLVDEYQVVEAVAHGADTALLMVSILSLSRLRALIACCRQWGLEPLVEVVTARELKVALDAGAKVIGVNNRNLHTFELDKTRTAQVAVQLRDTFKIPFGQGHATKLLALSGLASAEDVAECRGIACSGVLIGEALMRAPDPRAAIAELMGGSRAADGADPSGGLAPALPVVPGAVVVKVCGVVKADDSRCAIEAGANLVGVIFATSKRRAAPAQAKEVVATVRRFGERTAAVEAPAREAGGAEAAEATTTVAKRSALLRAACKRTPLVVGVFMDQALEEVVEVCRATGVDAVQLHGKEAPGFLAQLGQRLPGVWMIKVVHLPPRAEASATALATEAEDEELQQRLRSYAGLCDAILLDTAVKGSVSGGTGAVFDWQTARRVQERWGVPVIVAGGLTDANVAECVSSALPFGVDVASGVEDAPGQKNAAKVTGYVRAAKRARTGD